MKVSTVIMTGLITLLLVAVMYRTKTLRDLFLSETKLPFGVEINQPNIIIK